MVLIRINKNFIILSALLVAIHFAWWVFSGYFFEEVFASLTKLLFCGFTFYVAAGKNYIIAND